MLDYKFYIFLMVFLFSCLIVIYKRYKLNASHMDILDPCILFIIIYFMYSLASALRALKYGNDDIGIITDSILNEYYLSILIGLWGFGIGSLTKTKNVIFSNDIFSNKNYIKVFYVVAAITLILLFPFYYSKFNFIDIPSYKETMFSSRLEFSESTTSGLKEVLLTNLPISLLFTICTIKFFKTNKLVPKFLYLVPFIIFVIVNTLSGWRGLVISSFIPPILYYHYQVRKLNAYKVIFFGIAAYVFMPLLSIMRSSSNPEIMIKILTDHFDIIKWNFLSLENNSELITGLNLMTLIRGFEIGQTSFTYGLSIITDLFSFIPRFIFPTRPDNLPVTFIKLFYPQVHAAGGGYGFFIIQEGYWAFGKIGVFIYMFIYGILIKTIYSSLLKNPSPMIIIIYSYIFTYLVIYSTRSGIITSFKATFLALVPFIIIAIITQLLTSRRN